MAIIVCRIIEVCVFRFVNDRSEYLLLKRSPDEKIYPDIWQFVSGSIEDGEKAFDAALRELREETGLAPKRFWVVPHINTFYDHSYDAVNLSPVFAAQVGGSDEPRLSSEHCAYEWLHVDRARPRLVWPEQRSGLEIVEKYILAGEQGGILTEIKI